MKSIIPTIICIIFFVFPSLKAQEQYVVNGESLSLNSEVKGELELLYYGSKRDYRYFLKKGDYITELKDTKKNKRYQHEYIEVLEEHTSDAPVSTEKVYLILPSLQRFFVEYNAIKDTNFVDPKVDPNLKLRLGVYGGFTNSIYTINVENTKQAVAGLDLELIDPVKLKRHSFVLGFRHTFESDDTNYSASQLNLNYRFKFIKYSRFEMYVNAKFASLTFVKNEIESISDDGAYIVNDSATNFGSPLSFGVGADIRVGKGFITLGYHDFVALNLDSNKETPLDFSLGYKFML